MSRVMSRIYYLGTVTIWVLNLSMTKFLQSQKNSLLETNKRRSRSRIVPSTQQPLSNLPFHPLKTHRDRPVKANVLMHGCRLSRVEGQVPYYGGKQK